MERHEESRIWVGIDIGNTKSEYIAADGSGTVLAYQIGPGANHQSIGSSEARALLSSVYHELIDGLGKPAYVFVGAAGADTPADFEALLDVFRGVFGDTPFSFDNDGLVALKNGVEDQPGIVVTCGTGNTNFAIDRSGRVERIGGLTDHLGDRLGAYAIARATTSAAVRAEDRRDAPSVLPELLKRTFGVTSMAELINVDLDADSVRIIIETLFDATAMGDGRALSIAWEFTREIVGIVDLFAASLFRDGAPFRLVLDGPVYRANYVDFMTMIRLAVTSRYPAEIVVPSTPPVVGALYLALERSGVTLGPRHFAAVRDSIPARKVLT